MLYLLVEKSVFFNPIIIQVLLSMVSVVSITLLMAEDEVSVIIEFILNVLIFLSLLLFLSLNYLFKTRSLVCTVEVVLSVFDKLQRKSRFS